MPDDDVQQPRHSRTRPAAEPRPARPGSTRPARDDERPLDHLPDAAREVIRQPADPRLDAHLARMGLLPDDATAASDEAAETSASPAPAEPAAVARASQRTSPVPAASSAELDRLRGELAVARLAADAAGRRVAALSILLAAATVVIVILLVGALLR